MPQWALHLLGSPRLERDGSRVEIQRRKVMALLIYLAVTGKSHSRDTLAALFWPEHDQVSARAAFRRALSDLQKILGVNHILVEQDSIHLEPNPDFCLDIDDFRRRLEAYRVHAHHPNDPCPDCLAALTEAVSLYKDDFLTGFTLSDSLEFDEWQMLQAEILHRELIGALGRLVLGHAANGDIEAAIHSAHRWLALEPVDEVAHRHLIQLYSWNGNRSQALRQYQECVRILERELGVSPQAETTALYEHIRTQKDSPEGAPRLKPISPPRKPNNLPVQLTSFMGRAVELATVIGEISRPDVHLLTLTGPAGVGKTRLSLEVAAQLLDQFADGAFFVSLASLRDPTLIGPTIAHVLGIRESRSAPLLETLKDYVRDRQMLLVLDNFEHLTPAAPLVTELLAAAPHLKVLVTSRILLHVYGEHLHPVLPMALPRPAGKELLENIARSEAVQFFVDRARAVKADFTLLDENCQAVSEICVRLDGLPLAIELAAARVRQISPQAILGQWTQAGSRTPLQTLTDGPRDLPARHQTLRNAIAWSYNLLEADEQKVFQRAGIFVGGWSLEAADKVIADPMPGGSKGAAVSVPAAPIANLLESLVDKALIEQSNCDGETRFAMLETVREYALEKLAACEELDVFQDRHTAYYLAFAENARQNLFGPQQTAWVNRLAQEYDNLRAALKRAVDHQKAETALRLGGALGKFWYIYDPIYWSEGRSWLEQALRMPTLGTIPLDIQAKALNEAGVLAWVQADYPQAIRRFEESLALRRKLGDKTGIGSALGNLGLVAREQLDLPRARAYQEEVLALRREMGDKQGIATALGNLGLVAADQGDIGYAAALYEESIQLNRELQNKSGLTMTLHNLGGLLVESLKDFPRVKALLEESLALSHELGKNFFLIPYTLNHLGNLALYQNDTRQARELLEQGLALSRESNNAFGIGYVLYSFGRLYNLEGEHEKAQECFQKSVLTLQEVNGLVGIIWDFISMAGLACKNGHPRRAATLLGASESLREKTFTALLAAKTEEYQSNLTAARALLNAVDFDRGWAAGRAMSLEQALAYAVEVR